MGRKASNGFFMAGVGVVIASILLMQTRYSAGIVKSILQGAHILNTDIEVRWPLLAGFGLVCWGIYLRLNSK
jgi:hypothetical protein